MLSGSGDDEVATFCTGGGMAGAGLGCAGDRVNGFTFGCGTGLEKNERLGADDGVTGFGVGIGVGAGLGADWSTVGFGGSVGAGVGAGLGVGAGFGAAGFPPPKSFETALGLGCSSICWPLTSTVFFLGVMPSIISLLAARAPR